MNTITKDILTVKQGVIIHQVNFKGKIGGLARAIFEKWPDALEDYREKAKYSALGDFISYRVSDGLILISAFCQKDVNPRVRQTNYGAWSLVLNSLRFYLSGTTFRPSEFYFPYMVGCGLGGGDWTVISEMLDFYFPDSTICRLP